MFKTCVRYLERNGHVVLVLESVPDLAGDAEL